MILSILKAILGITGKDVAVQVWPTAENTNRSWGTSGYDRHFIR